jgi:hypothetical protein
VISQLPKAEVLLQALRTAQILGENIGGRLKISPDGKFLAYPHRESTPVPATKLAIVPAEGGSPTKVLSAPAVVWGLLLVATR